MKRIGGTLTPDALAALTGAQSQRATVIPRPIGICLNCFAAWRARQPRPAAVYCHHFGNAARLEPDGWRVFEAIGAKALAGMRGEL
jgi:hypothetical protein